MRYVWLKDRPGLFTDGCRGLHAPIQAQVEKKWGAPFSVEAVFLRLVVIGEQEMDDEENVGV